MYYEKIKGRIKGLFKPRQSGDNEFIGLKKRFKIGETGFDFWISIRPLNNGMIIVFGMIRLAYRINCLKLMLKDLR